MARFGLPTLTVVCIVLAALSGACQSLSKKDLTVRLAALPKNARIAELSKLEFRADLGEGVAPYTLLYHHAPAKIPSGELPVVLVHNSPSTLYSWTELIYGVQAPGISGTPDRARISEPYALSENRAVYAIEVIGHGVAPGDAGPYGFERCAKFVEAAIRALDIGEVHLVGSSYGGEFAWRAAVNAPELTASLTVLDSSGYPRRSGDWLSEEVLMRENSLAKYGWLVNSRARVKSALVPHFASIPMNRVDEFFYVCENAHNWSAMIDLVRDENGSRSDEISSILTPTLVLWGANDLAYELGHYGQLFVQDIPNSELVVISGAGHYPHEEQPAAVLSALVKFFDKVEHAR